MAIQEFPFALDRRFALPLRAFGVTPKRAWVRVEDGMLRARYGFFSFETPLGNVRDAQVGGPYKTYKALGPRLSIVDWGATYGTSSAAGVCVLFHEAVPVLPPIRNPGVTLTVQDPQGLAEAIRNGKA